MTSRLPAAAFALTLCACPSPQMTSPDGSVPDGSTPDAGAPDGSVGLPPDAGVAAFTLGPIATPLRVRTELDRAIETKLVSLGGRALVVSSSDTPGCYLWATNGTAETTGILTQLSTDGTRCTQSSQVLHFAPVVAQGAAYFTWGTGTKGPLWRSDGTQAGTRKLSPPAEPDSLYALSDRVLMLLQQGTTWELWQYLPAADQFEKLTALATPLGPPFFRGHVQLGGVHHFSLGLAGRWQTDLTPAGTVPAGPMPDLISEGVGQGARVVVRGNGPQGSGIYVADGTDAGLQLVAGDVVDGGRIAVHSELRLIGSRAVFVRSDGSFGSPPERAGLLALEPGQTVPVPLGAVTDEAFTWWIAARDGGAWYAARRDAGEDLYFTDGVAPSTRVAALPHDTLSGAQLGDRFLIQNIATFTYPGRTYDVWITGGADGGPERLLNTGSPQAFAFTDAGVALWEGTSLFRTDFTWEGTTPYRTLWSMAPYAPIAMTRRPFACAIVTERLAPSLWCTDGTPAGTRQVAALTDFGGLVRAGPDHAALVDRDAVVVTDGTPAGTWRYVPTPGLALSNVVAIDAEHAFVSGAGGSFVLDLTTWTRAPITGFAPLNLQNAILGGGRLAVIDALDTVKVIDATGAVTPLAGVPANAQTLVSDGTRGWMIERPPPDGGPGGVWSLDTPPARVGAMHSPWSTLVHRGALYAVSGSPVTQPTEVFVTRFSPARPPHEVLRQPFVPVAYNFWVSPVGARVALFAPAGLQLHDPAIDRTWSPFPSLGRVALPSAVAGDDGFTFITADGGVFAYDLAREAVVGFDGGMPAAPQGLAGVGPRTVFWARDALGWGPWAATP